MIGRLDYLEINPKAVNGLASANKQHECTFFDESERAALAWAEALALLPETKAPDDLYDSLKAHYSEQQIVDLTLIISLINAWNRLAVGLRHLPEPRP